MSEHDDTQGARCERWETDGLLALERGETLDPHFDTCPDCLAARSAGEAVVARLLQASAGWQPPGDWEARVFARIAREQPARRFAWWQVLFPVLAAAGLAIWLARPATPGGGADPNAAPLGLSLSVVDAAQVVRGENPKPGDALSLRVAVGGAAHVGLRVYRDDRTLVFACGHADACPRTGDEVVTRVTMDAPGTYRTLLMGGAAALPAPAGSLDADMARAREAGLQIVVGEVVRVW